MTIRVRFVTAPHDMISWFIRGATTGFIFSHTEVCMPDGTLLGAHADGGVEARPEGYDAAYKPVEAIVEVPATEEQTAACHDFLLEQLHKPYDFEAIAALAGRELWPDEEAILRENTAPWTIPTKWFCSELVEAALESAAILPKLSVTAQRVTPRDLWFRLSAVAAMPPPSQPSRPQAVEIKARPV